MGNLDILKKSLEVVGNNPHIITMEQFANELKNVIETFEEEDENLDSDKDTYWAESGIE